MKQILTATDFSENAEAAVAMAVQTARALHARLHLLHVFGPGEIGVTELLADAAATAAPDVAVTVAATGGDAAQEILRYTTRHPIDLIVVGTHGRTGLSRALLGSVAERVLRGARCPVLVVPAASDQMTSGASQAGVTEDVETPAPRGCLVCGTPTPDLICEPCRARIRGEALEHKQREERAGRT